jgi:hypothetical protein
MRRKRRQLAAFPLYFRQWFLTFVSCFAVILTTLISRHFMCEINHRIAISPTVGSFTRHFSTSAYLQRNMSYSIKHIENGMNFHVYEISDSRSTTVKLYKPLSCPSLLAIFFDIEYTVVSEAYSKEH